MSNHPHNPSLHRLALLTACATFPLIFMGGLVTSHGAGMSVPDWPNSYGYNMFLFPPRLWIGGILYEHTHRLMGAVVGILAILLCITAWKTEPRQWVKWLATSVLGVVILQGILGGLRVVLVQLDLAIVHACLAQAFFCLTALMVIVTSKWWALTPSPLVRGPAEREGKGWGEGEDATRQGAPNRGQSSLIRAAAIALSVIYLQLILGAVMRHYEAGLAIPDFPLNYGKIIPPLTGPELNAANSRRAFALNLPQVTRGQIWIHFAHRLGALAVLIAIAILTHKAFRLKRPELTRPCLLLIALLIVQLTLGLLTVALRKPADIASAHVAVGALVLVTTFVILVRSMRLYSPAWRWSREGFEVLTAPNLTTAAA